MSGAGVASCNLFFKEGRSDKVYNVAVEVEGGGFVVSFSYGRRGGPLKTGRKTAEPTDLAAAMAIYEKLCREKRAKGYREGPGAPQVHQQGETGGRTSFQPQLLNAVTLHEAVRLVMEAPGGRWSIQRKLDGQRRFIGLSGGRLIAANRKGLAVTVNDSIAREIAGLGARSIELDGEDLGDRFVAFNILEMDGERYDARPFAAAAAKLAELAQRPGLRALAFEVPQRIVSAGGLLSRIDAFRAQGEEGVVLRDMEAATEAGRPASGGAARKLKFVETATVRVRSVNGAKRSVQMEVRDGDSWREIGSVTVPPDQGVPKEGELVEVRYLYAFPGGALYQPLLLGRRDDVDEAAADISQIKLKGEGRTAA